jgi:hypothetical protein
MPGSVTQWTLVVFVKRHPCTLNVWRQLTDWREQVTAWHDLHGLLYSHSNTVCLLIQSNCIELQPSTSILIWVVWFFWSFCITESQSNFSLATNRQFWCLEHKNWFSKPMEMSFIRQRLLLQISKSVPFRKMKSKNWVAC